VGRKAGLRIVRGSFLPGGREQLLRNVIRCITHPGLVRERPPEAAALPRLAAAPPARPPPPKIRDITTPEDLEDAEDTTAALEWKARDAAGQTTFVPASEARRRLGIPV
jgi:hypothetical protein